MVPHLLFWNPSTMQMKYHSFSAKMPLENVSKTFFSHHATMKNFELSVSYVGASTLRSYFAIKCPTLFNLFSSHVFSYCSHFIRINSVNITFEYSKTKMCKKVAPCNAKKNANRLSMRQYTA